MTDDQILVRGVSGEDMLITVAGPGSRSYAFVIDWHIRLLLALGWLLMGTLVVRIGGIWKSYEFLFSVLPTLIIYFLYHPVLEIALQGSTPGKRMAGVRILTRTGGVPNRVALLIRNLFRLVDSLPVGYLVGLVSCLATSQRVRIGDMAAGTLLVLVKSESELITIRLKVAAGQTPLPLDALELVDELLERWDSLEPGNRTRIAASLLMRIQPNLAVSGASLSEQQLRSKLQSVLACADAVGVPSDTRIHG